MEELHTDRTRAESFGAASDEYDRYRPRYPEALIAELDPRGATTLDVGAGTGISSVQLMQAGATVLAVEPDPRMAGIAAGKGVSAEITTFEDWQPADRTFDLVVFAQSFHWVQPRPALAKVRSILNAGGRLVLLSNRIVPQSPTWPDLDDIYSDYLPEARSSIVDATRLAEVTALIEDGGFTVDKRSAIEQLRYASEDWLNLVFTYSNHLTLPPSVRDELRSRLADRIGTDGVDAINDALAVICTPV